MNSSETLKNAIRFFLNEKTMAGLKKASAELSDRYRHRIQQSQQLMDTDSIRLAYLICRMPATHAAILNVFRELRGKMPDVSFERMLDIGAGPGTAWWAGKEVFSSLAQGTLLEKDPQMIDLGRKLFFQGGIDPPSWKQEDAVRAGAFEPHSLIVLSYMLGELLEKDQMDVIEKAWKSAESTLVLIEPGTPAGFRTLLRARLQLLSLGAHLVAPCPHAGRCPMQGEDWCHFSVRVERMREHRLAKEGTLSYEDEKYAYLIVSKMQNPLPRARVLAPPLKRSGHVLLKLCTVEGVEQEIISKRNKEVFKKARKIDWGDSL